MNITELIKILQQYPPSAEVQHISVVGYGLDSEDIVEPLTQGHINFDSKNNTITFMLTE